MKKVDVWMPLYIGDYLSDTIGLTHAEHGAYLLSIMAYWKKGGPLSVTESVSIMSQSYDRVCQFYEIVGDTLVHPRIEKELENAKHAKEAQLARTEAAREAKSRKVTAAVTSPVTDSVTSTVTTSPSPSPSYKNLSQIHCRISSDRVSPEIPKPAKKEKSALRFNEFWESYPKCPRKTNKPGCLKTWKSKNLDSLADKILADLAARRGNKQWEEFTPMPSTYLNQERWNDEPLDNPFERIL